MIVVIKRIKNHLAYPRNDNVFLQKKIDKY